MQLEHKTAVITGGTSGIGLGLARRLATLGCRVIVGSRSQQHIDATLREMPGIRGFALDVADERSVASFRDRALAELGHVDIVINSAGIMRPYDLLDPSVAIGQLTAEIRINLIGTIGVTTAFLPELRRWPESLVVTISSGLAYLSSAAHPVYSATKAGVHMFTDALRGQLEYAGEDKTHVMELIPPLVSETSLEEHTSAGVPDMSVAELVDAAIDGMRQDASQVAPGFAQQLMSMGRDDPQAHERAFANATLPEYFPHGL